MRISDWSSDVCSSDLGRQFADGWRERVYEFLGFSNNYDTFGMSEIVAGNSKCEVGNYHFPPRSEEHTSELQSLMRISYAVFCLKKKKQNNSTRNIYVRTQY